MRQNTYAFIIRIWHEAVDEKGKALIWRGSIEPVGSGECFHFDDMPELVDFIRTRSRLDNKPTAAWWRSLFGWMRL